MRIDVVLNPPKTVPKYGLKFYESDAKERLTNALKRHSTVHVLCHIEELFVAYKSIHFTEEQTKKKSVPKLIDEFLDELLAEAKTVLEHEYITNFSLHAYLDIKDYHREKFGMHNKWKKRFIEDFNF